jgi:hypothetical protein
MRWSPRVPGFATTRVAVLALSPDGTPLAVAVRSYDGTLRLTGPDDSLPARAS